MNLRHFLSWKSLFYGGLLPALRALGPARGDAILGATGRLVVSAWPARRRVLLEALERVNEALSAGWDCPALLPQLAANLARFQARECLLDGASDRAFFARFDLTGYEHVEAARAQGRGVILVGSHLGAHLSASHWLYRKGLPLRMLIQRPGHVSNDLDRRFNDADGPLAQASFFLRRDLEPGEASKRIFRTRTALRAGMLVYLKGDVPWVGANTRPGRLVGQALTFQSLWAEFAALFRAPVVPVFCTHQQRGRYRLTFDAPFLVARGEEGAAIDRYLARLDDEIRAHPADAVGHLLWPCYGPVRAESHPRSTERPSRRAPRRDRAGSAH